MVNKIGQITVNKLQAKLSQILKKVESGTTYKIMRYSDEIAVMISAKKYQRLTDEINELKGDCKFCVKELRKIKETK